MSENELEKVNLEDNLNIKLEESNKKNKNSKAKITESQEGKKERWMELYKIVNHLIFIIFKIFFIFQNYVLKYFKRISRKINLESKLKPKTKSKDSKMT